MDSRFREAVDAFQRGDFGTALDIARANGDSSAAEWQHLIGLIHCRTGNPETGAIHLRAASKARPDNHSFRLMLARALVDSGAAGEVLEMPEPAGLGSQAALQWWHVRAEAAEKLGDPSAAAQAWRSVTALTPGDHRAWLNLGRSLLRIDSLVDAADCYRRALAISPTDLAALHELALLLERMSQIEAMADMLEWAHANGVGRDRLPFAWALLEQRRGDAREALRLLRLPGADEDRNRWYRLLAKVEDMLGHSSEAFAASSSMNRSVAQFDLWRSRASAYRQDLRAIADTISDGWPPEVPALPPVGQSPVFILGFPRSGTTLLDTFLMGHRDIEVLEELPLLSDAGNLLGPLGNLPQAGKQALEAAREHYLGSLAAASRSPKAKVIVDKFPLNMTAVSLIHCLFPGAPIIFAQRHPCDCVLSGFMQSFVSNLGNSSFLELGDAADFYDACMSVWTASCAKLPLNVRTVRYEELVAEPESTLRQLIDWLGLDWDEGILDHRATAVRRGPIANTSYNQVTEPLTAAPVLRWRRYEKELAPVLPILLSWAERLGYEA